MKHLRLIALPLCILVYNVANSQSIFEPLKAVETNGITTVKSNNMLCSVFDNFTDEYYNVFGTVYISNPSSVGRIILKIYSQDPLWTFMDKDEPMMLISLKLDNGLSIDFPKSNSLSILADKKSSINDKEYYFTEILVLLTDDCMIEGIDLPADRQEQNEFLIDYLKEYEIVCFDVLAESVLATDLPLFYTIKFNPLYTDEMFKLVFADTNDTEPKELDLSYFDYKRDLTVDDLINRPMGCFTTFDISAKDMYDVICSDPAIFGHPFYDIKPKFDIVNLDIWANVFSYLMLDKMFFMGYEIESVGVDYLNKDTICKNSFSIPYKRTFSSFAPKDIKKIKKDMAEKFANAFIAEGFDMQKKKWSDSWGYEGSNGDIKVVITYINDDLTDSVSIWIEYD